MNAIVKDANPITCNQTVISSIQKIKIFTSTETEFQIGTNYPFEKMALAMKVSELPPKFFALPFKQEIVL